MLRSAVVLIAAVVVGGAALWLWRGGTPLDSPQSDRPPVEELGTTLPRPSVEYSGRLSISAGVLTLEGPIHYRPDMEARALKLRGTQVPAKTVVMRHDEGVIWVIDPATRSYLRAPMGAGVPQPGDLVSGTIAEATRLGVEVVDGIETTRFRVRFAETGGTALTGTLWITADHVVLRLDGEVTQAGHTTPVAIHLSEFEIGPQPRDLFQPPSDYTLVPPSHPTLGIVATPAPTPPSPGEAAAVPGGRR